VTDAAFDAAAPLELVERHGPVAAPPPGTVLSDRYRVERPLKRGSPLQTLLGVDLVEGAPVVIKAAPASSVSEWARMRLEHDIEMLGGVRAPAFSRPLHLGEERDLVYLVSRRLSGLTLAARLEGGALSVPETLLVGRSILTALAQAHGVEVFHRDVKPVNVIVGDRLPLGSATLIDFGLPRGTLVEPPIQAQLVAAARYVSPEQAGLLDRDVDGRSDLYSAGVLLYECLAGHPPFEAETVGELLRLHLTARPAELRSLGLDVPRALDEVLQRLLAKDPRDRYQSAAAVLADLTAIDDARQKGVSDPSLVVGRRDVRRALTEPAFVGREEELAALTREVERAGPGNGGLVTLEAESGGGKTRLLDELAQRSMRDGIWVLRGRGADQSAQAPFHLLSGIVDDILSAASLDSGRARVLQERLREHAAAVCASFPALGELLDVKVSEDLGPELFAETRNLDALSALLDALGSPARPALVVLDDCQWADALTVKLLAHRQQQARTGGRNVAVVIAFRSEEVEEGHGLRGLEATRLALPRFSDQNVMLLAESMAGELPDAALDTVTMLSEGNPFMASAVLRGLVESGALVESASGWKVDTEAMSSAQSSSEAAAFLSRRLDLLPPRTLELMAAGAVLGKEFDLGLAAGLTRQSSKEAIAAVEQARRRQIVWAGQRQTRCTFVHDKVRDAVLRRLDADERRTLHERAARHLERRAPDRVFELAYHFDAAGDHARALLYALRAAAEARARHALEAAHEQYHIAERGVDFADRDARLELALGLGDVLMLLGRYDEAEKRLLSARTLADELPARAQIDGKLGELSFKRGDVAYASLAIERGLRLLGERVPRTRIGSTALLVWEIVIQALHSIFGRRVLGRRALDDGASDLLAARLYSRLAHAYWFGRGKLPTLWAHLRGMNIAERYPPTLELGQAYSEHAPVMTMLPWFSRGVAYAERSLEIRRSLRDTWGEGQSLHFYGVVLYGASRYGEVLEHCRDAVRLLERTGDRWELNTASWHIAFAHYRRGELEQAVQAARAVHAAGLEIGDAQASGIAMGAWAKASDGRIPAEALVRELRRGSDDVHTRAEVLQAHALSLLNSGRPAKAADVLEDAWRLVLSKGLMQEYVAPILPWRATALRLAADGLPAWTTWSRGRRLRELRRAVRGSLRIARRYRNNLPHALRELALYELGRGRARRARRCFDRSLREARGQGARYEYLQTLLARGRAGEELGWASAAEDIVDAQRGLAAIGAVPLGALDWPTGGAATQAPTPLSVADRFSTLLVVGRGITSALSRDAVFDSVRRAAISLLRGDRCAVLAIPQDGRAEDLAAASAEPDEVDPLCRAMAARAISEGETVVFPEGESLADSARTAGVRSAVCVPIHVRGRPAACLYVAHGAVEDLFGEEDRRLAGFVATLAGAALENAEGFSEIRALTRTLEGRTTELEATNRRLDGSVAELSEAYGRERETARQLKHMALHDSLTRLGNRALFLDRVEHALARARRIGGEVAVLFFDLDDFKTINDSLGHSTGDLVLVSVAERLRDCLRHADTAARLGGDEFAVLLEDIDSADDAGRSAERILEAVHAPFMVEGKQVFIHGSIGIALGPSGGSSGEGVELLRNADMAMYIAKGKGKGRYEFFEPRMHTGVLQRLELKADLERAIHEGEFTIHYQPIVVLGSGAIEGMEALVRWDHPERGLIPPGDFLPLAEETGLVVEIGNWVLTEACRQAVAWRAWPGASGPLQVSVNLSPSQIDQPELVTDVADALRESGLDADGLVLEITEGVLMQDTDSVIRKLARLKRLGLRLAIDDFGTGYSSLEYLRRFPFDVIKVAKPFVDGVTQGPEESALARAIIKLGDTFDLQTVAEGIEDAAQIRELEQMGCTLGQGYLFSRALEPAQMDPLVREGRVAVG
jgi:diguanylate cyclase (GGDEF)-like protein